MPGTHIRFALCLMLICWTAVIPASAQHFRQIPGTVDYVFAGRAEVWGVQCTEAFCITSKVYRFNSSTKKFAEIPGAPNIQNIAVGGGTVLQPDEVWGLDNDTNDVYRFNFSKNAFVKVPGISLFQITVGEGYEDKCHPYEVWGNWGPNVAVPAVYRYNYCTSKFDAIPLPAPSGTPLPLTQIAVGGEGNVWGVVVDSQLGTFGTGLFIYAGGWGGPVGLDANSGWMPSFQPIAVTTMNVYGFEDGLSVLNLAISDACSCYWGSSPSGTASLTQIASGWEGVWLIYNTSSANGLIARSQGFSISGYGGDFATGFSNVPGLASPALSIAVGSGAGVWATDSSHHVYVFVRP